MQVDVEGLGVNGAGFLAPGVEDEAEEELAFGGDQSFRERPGLGEQKPGPVAQ
jgi:hypothetical protein